MPQPDPYTAMAVVEEAGRDELCNLRPQVIMPQNLPRIERAGEEVAGHLQGDEPQCAKGSPQVH